MSDLWERAQNIKEELKIIKEALVDWKYCCIASIKKGNKTILKCSRYELPKEEFDEKCRACKEEVREFLLGLK